jgi:hypothetical protein
MDSIERYAQGTQTGIHNLKFFQQRGRALKADRGCTMLCGHHPMHDQHGSPIGSVFYRGPRRVQRRQFCGHCAACMTAVANFGHSSQHHGRLADTAAQSTSGAIQHLAARNSSITCDWSLGITEKARNYEGGAFA